MPLPVGLRVAGAGARLGAWLLDLLVFGLLSLIPLALAVATGAVGLNPEAVRQMNVNPYVEPTVPLLSVNVAPLIAWCTVWVVLAVAYAAACWARFRGLPGQRLLSLQVADAATGKNLSLPRATWRAVLVSGIPAAATAVLLVAMCELLATVIPADIAGAGGTSYINATYNDTGGDFVSLCSLASWAWPLLLLISTAASRDRRGLHDRLARSVVVGRAKAFGAWGTAYAQVPYGPPGFPYGPPGFPYGPGPTPGSGPGYAPWPVYPYGPQPGAPDLPQADLASGGELPALGEPPAAVGGGEPAERKAAADSDNRQVFGAKLPAGLRVASFNRRVVAYVVDNVIALLLFGGIAMALEGSSDSSGTPPERIAMIAGLIGGLVQAVYFVATWSIWRGSIGQKALGLQVGEESTGHRLSPADSLVRWALLQGPLALYLAVPYLLRPAFGILTIGWAWLLTYSARKDPDRRGYHDRIAHSLVVEQA
jgi:hypothetical protein